MKRIYNLTDHERFCSTVINIYNGHIFPGSSIQLSEDLVTDKVLALGDKIAIDTLPEYYRKWKEGPLAPPIEIEVEKIAVKTEPLEKKSGRK